MIKMIMKNGMFTKETNINEDGTVEYINNNQVTKKIINIYEDIINYIEEEIIKEHTPSKFDELCEIVYKDKIVKDSKLYSDIDLMIRNDKVLDTINKNNTEMRNKKEEQKIEVIEKENKIKEYIPLLDKMKKEKIEFDPYSIDSNNKIKVKDSIKFDLVQKEEFKIGETRFYSDTIDIDDSIKYPEFLQFVGQINLEEFSKYDNNNLLPKEGYLYFFEAPFIDDKYYEYGKVTYSNSNNLVRKNTFIYDDYMKLNVGIKEIILEQDNIEDRFKNNKYDSLYGSEDNKVFGLYNDCQVDEEGVYNVSDNYVVLLQLGDTIYGEGTTSFLIKEDDLKNKDFSNVIYVYSQS